MMSPGTCGICGEPLLQKEERERKLCIGCWKRGFRAPLLNKRVFVIPAKTTGVVRVIDKERKEAMVEFPAGKKSKKFWKKGGWFTIFELRLWTRKRARKLKKDERLWRKEPMP